MYALKINRTAAIGLNKDKIELWSATFVFHLHLQNEKRADKIRTYIYIYILYLRIRKKKKEHFVLKSILV